MLFRVDLEPSLLLCAHDQDTRGVFIQAVNNIAQVFVQTACSFSRLVQEEAATGSDGEAPKEAKEGMYFAEADTAAAAVAVARTEAHESVHHKEEEAGGAGTLDDKNSTRERRALLQKLVLEHGVGGLETKVRKQKKFCGVADAIVATSFQYFYMRVKGRCG